MEALQALRLMTRGRERLPVIMLSADVTPEAKREALEAGADAFLAKPIEALRLLDEIQRLAGAKDSSPPRKVEPAAASTSAAARRRRGGQCRDARASGGAGFLARLRREADPRVPRRRLVDPRCASSRRSPAATTTSSARCVHAMKGSSASMGTDRLTQLCGRLGKLSDAELRLQAPALHRKLGDELGRRAGSSSTTSQAAQIRRLAYARRVDEPGCSGIARGTAAAAARTRRLRARRPALYEPGGREPRRVALLHCGAGIPRASLPPLRALSRASPESRP